MSHARAPRHGKWEGFEALHAALQGLASTKGTSQNRIGAVAKLALQNAKFYKHVVHDVEVFLWKAEPEHRLAGLYAIDAIVRQGGTRSEAREQYAKRFGIRLADTLVAVKGASPEAQTKVRQVIEEWQRRGIYSPSVIEAAGGRDYVLRDEAARHDGDHHSPTRSSSTPTSSTGKLASLLSILKKKKELEHDHPSSDAADQGFRSERGDRQPQHDAYDERHTDPQVYGQHQEQQQQRQQFRSHSNDERRGQRPTPGIMGDAPPPSILGAGPPQAAISDNRAKEWTEDAGRSVKKQRSSRWGPPKAVGEAPADSRPPPIVTSAPTDTYSRSSGVSDSRVPASFHNPQDGFRPPSDGRGPESFGRYDGAPSQPPRHNGPDGSVNHGFSSRPEDNRFAPTSGPNGAGPSPRFADRPSPHQPQESMQAPPNQPPGGSGELCRKFVGGRCTYGDRCWHVHSLQSAPSPAPQPVATEMKRKTVLCNNFPLGTCRYGDKCSFAHGVEDLGSMRPNLPPAGGWNASNESPRGRWNPASGAPPPAAGTSAPQSFPVHPSSSAPAGFPAQQHLPRQNGAGVPPRAVFNEPGSAGAPPQSNGAIIGTGAHPPAPPPPTRLQAPAAPYGAGRPGVPPPPPPPFAQVQRAAGFTGVPGPNGMRAGPSGVPPRMFGAADKTAGFAGSNPRGATTAPASRLDDDDDEPEAPVEEFTLQYDDED